MTPGVSLPNLGLTGDIPDHATWGTEGRANDRRIDALVMSSVKDQLSAPPASPQDGDRYLVAAGATGAWSGQATKIAQWNAAINAWVFYSPHKGWEVYLESAGTQLRYGTQWFRAEMVLNVKDFGAVADGVTDDAPALNTLFDFVGALTAGPTAVYFPRGTYFIKAPVVVDGPSLSSPVAGLRLIADSGTIIKAATPAQGGSWGTSGSLFKFRASTSPVTDVVIEGFIFDGSAFGTTIAAGGATNNSTMGIYTTAIVGATVRNCTFKNLGDVALGPASSPRNDGILLGDLAGGASARAKDVRIEQCRFVNCVRNGISMIDVDGVTVDDCYFENIDNSGIDIEPNLATQFARDIAIKRCTFNDWREAAVIAIPGAAILTVNYPAQMEGLKVSDCYMDGAVVGKQGVQAYNWIDVDISRNTIIRVIDPALYVRGCQLARIVGNHIRDCTATTGAILIDKPQTPQPQDIVIQGNTMKTIAGYGIRVGDLDTGSIIGNNIRVYDTASANRAGISLVVGTATCKNVAVVGNVVVGGVVGLPITIAAGCTRMLCVGNICQENGAGAATDAIDNDAASTIHGFNCDDQRASRLFTGIGTTPLTATIVGQSVAARKVCLEVTVAAGAGAGSVSTASDIINTANAGNVIFSPINVAAAAMAGSAIGVYCSRTATGFDLVHNGNAAGTAAIFMCILIPA